MSYQERRVRFQGCGGVQAERQGAIREIMQEVGADPKKPPCLRGGASACHGEGSGAGRGINGTPKSSSPVREKLPVYSTCFRPHPKTASLAFATTMTGWVEYPRVTSVS